MKKAFKIFLYTIVGLFSIVFLATLIAPTFFKDDIQKAADEAIAENLNAKVYYDLDQLSVSIISNFPNLTIGLGDFGIVGVDDFKSDTLVALKKFEVAVDIMSVITGDQMVINGIYLINPYIKGVVLQDGKANWDIVKATGSETEEIEIEETDSEAFAMNIKEVVIENGTVLYFDFQGHTFASILGLDHKSSVSLGEVYDINSLTSFASLSAEYEGVNYLKEDEFEAKIDALLDLENMKFSFKENSIRLNQFIFGFNGHTAITEDDGYDVDVTFEAKETSFKNILSLVPAVYLTDFNDLKTKGSLSFDGFAKGTYLEDQIPTFAFNLKVNDGMFQYPDLPESLHDVNIDFSATNQDGNLDNTVINLKNMHLELGKNPIQMSALVKNLVNYDMEANLKAKVNLEDVAKMYPIEGTELKGLLTADLSAQGIYDSTLNTIPTAQANFELVNGYVKSTEFPRPLEDIQVSTHINSKGSINNTTVDVDKFALTLDEEQFNATMHLKELDNVQYNFDFNGVIDIDKMLAIYPVEDMTLGGRISIDAFHTEGTLSDIETENYGALKTSGQLGITDFIFLSEDLPQGFKINKAAAGFNPSTISLQSFDGSIGKSDMQMDGEFKNYLGYLFSKTDTILKGNLNFASNTFDVNEWMTEEEIDSLAASGSEEEIPLEIFPVPGNVDFVLHSKLKNVLYDNMVIEDLTGNIIVKDQRVSMKDVFFNTLGGQFAMSGYYDTKVLSTPLFGYTMTMKNMEIEKTYEAFEMIRDLAPIAKSATGKFDMDLDLEGVLDQEMMPIYDVMSGKGKIYMHEAKLENAKVFEKVSQVTKKDMSTIDISNTKITFTIKDGKVLTDPFDISSGNMTMDLNGSSTVTGLLDYVAKVTVPGGDVTKAANSVLGDYGISMGEDITFDLGIIGDASNPDIKLRGVQGSGGKSVSGQAKELAKAKFKEEKAKYEAEAKERLEEEKKKAEAEAKKRIEEERKKAEAEAKKKLEAEKKKAEEDAKKKLEKEGKDLLKKFKF